ncbi:hypothetical protein E2C01_077421 [Portunus trituberculatus]|uniref:Uncharacterized protein n=1 Tax=Portunus trituberculatus TaxID=210409 RepID=A0A5B7ILC2_PORTR|nr:hypothetical protein [Portunus trituberculatus]
MRVEYTPTRLKIPSAPLTTQPEPPPQANKYWNKNECEANPPQTRNKMECRLYDDIASTMKLCLEREMEIGTASR